MKNGICYIVGAGENYGLNFALQSGDYVIAADGGLKYLKQAGIKADLVVGDFDTLHYKPDHPNVIALSEEKDDTDTLASMREGIRMGYSNFHIYCGMGGRIEHTVANMQLLAYLSQSNRKGLLFGKDCVITAVTNGSLTFSDNARGHISVFSFSDTAKGVYLKGLKYELYNATLTSTFPIGVSNEFTSKESIVTVTDGTILIVLPEEMKEEIFK